MRARTYEDFLNQIYEDIREDIICGSDTIKVIRSTISPFLDYFPIIEYYYEYDECDDNYEEIQVNELVRELKSNMIRCDSDTIK